MVNSFKADAAQRCLFGAEKSHFKSQTLGVTWHFCKIRPCNLSLILAPVTMVPSPLQLLFWSSGLYLPFWYITMETNLEKKIHKQVGLFLNIIFFVFTIPALHVGGILFLHLPLDGIASADTFPAALHPCWEADPQKSRGLGAPALQSTPSAQALFSVWISKRAHYAKWAQMNRVRRLHNRLRFHFAFNLLQAGCKAIHRDQLKRLQREWSWGGKENAPSTWRCMARVTRLTDCLAPFAGQTGIPSPAGSPLHRAHRWELGQCPRKGIALYRLYFLYSSSIPWQLLLRTTS